MSFARVEYIWVQTQKIYSGINEEQIEVSECLLSFGAESFVFQFGIQKFKDVRYTELQFCQLFCMGVKHDRSH